MKNTFDHALPNAEGYFGEYGGSFIPEELQKIMLQITAAYDECRQDPAFQDELARLYKHFVGRPSPIFHAENLSGKYGAPIYLKREDLNHTGAIRLITAWVKPWLQKKWARRNSLRKRGPASMVSLLLPPQLWSGWNVISTWER